MNNNLKVLKLFVGNKDRTFTIKKAAEALKINYKNVYEEITSLEKEGLIKIVRQGNSKVCEFSYKYHPKIVEIEEMRKQELFRNRDIKLIHDRIRETQSQFYCLVLFGSYAKGTNSRGSDIDLCLITDDQKAKDGVQSMVSITPLNIHLQDFTSENFLLMIGDKKFNVGNEIVMNNIVLYGIEAFYEMVNRVKQRAY